MRRPPVLVDAVDTIAYLRVSTDDQKREEKTSLADQLTAVTALAARLGRTLDPAHVFTDGGLSGRSAKDRPQFMALVAYCEEHPRPRRAPGLVLVLNTSRFGRFPNPDEAHHWRFRLAESGWLVRYAEGDESEDLVARHVMRAIGDAGATQYSVQLSANCKRGARGAAAKGLWQNEAPLGYRRLATGAGRDPIVLEPGQRKAKDQVVRLTPGPEAEQQLVRWMFDAYASGEYSMGTLARELQRRWPGRRWSRRTAQAVLQNPAYMGDVVWCRRPHDRWERKDTPVRAPSEWVVTRDAHPPLVSRALFDAVQARIRANARTLRRTDRGYALTGLLTCAQCGHPYIGGGGTRGPAEDPDRYRFYKCAGSDRGMCPGRVGTLIKRWIEPRVIDVLARVVTRPEMLVEIAAALDDELALLRTANSGGVRKREQQRTTLEAERERLVGAVGRGVLTDAEAAGRLAAIREELAQLARQVERNRFERRAEERLADERDRLLRLAADFPARARQLDGPALRELIRPWIHRAVVDKERRTLTMEIRRVPAVAGLSLPSALARPDLRTDQHARSAPGVIRRTIALYPQRRAPKRAAGGAR